MASIATQDRLLSRVEAAEYLGVRAQTLAVWQSTRRYQIPCAKVGAKAMYRLSDLDKWLASRTVNAAGDVQ
jgi:hypothetical protein